MECAEYIYSELESEENYPTADPATKLRLLS